MEEIKAGDIMIGNWFIGYDGKPFQWDAECFYLMQGEVSTSEMIYCPIPLTEDILLKAGFSKHKMSGYDTHFVYSLFIGGETIGITAIYNADFSIMLHGVARGVKYLHRLQNIIKIITGNDLKIEV